jgi:DNA (cytosine-5)-methyltransferase 1
MVLAPVPTVDIFAGPGGLGEGFSSFSSPSLPGFKVALSIEKEESAQQTLELRKFFRKFSSGQVPDAYYDYLRGDLSKGDLFRNHPDEAAEAKREAWLQTLSEQNHPATSRRIKETLAGTDTWVLIGGPPCQAYSLAGRSRMAGTDRASRQAFEQDHRHFLYQEYLRIIADHAPAIFVLENVKGILSSKVNEALIFEQIQRDLEAPLKALHPDSLGARAELEYQLFPIAGSMEGQRKFHYTPPEFIVRAENYGIPQARHRVILMGVRKDLTAKKPGFTAPSLISQPEVPASSVLNDLPELRSGLTEKDSPEGWSDAVRTGVNLILGLDDPLMWAAIPRALQQAKGIPESRGGRFIPGRSAPAYRPEWYSDARLGGFLNHETRGHLREDLYRYLFASVFAKAFLRSPNLVDFPASLLPEHANVQEALQGSMFADRFRVQLGTRASTTITSHISKDGHYYIHPDPLQCRSLTVREAARLQTFPDNYFFEAARTRQYVQVGNAVPPLLGQQIARVVAETLHHLLQDELDD